MDGLGNVGKHMCNKMCKIEFLRIGIFNILDYAISMKLGDVFV